MYGEPGEPSHEKPLGGFGECRAVERHELTDLTPAVSECV